MLLGPAQYGKAEVRMLHVDRAGPRHEITDLNVTVTLAGDMAETYLTGDNSGVLTTDAQKNTSAASGALEWRRHRQSATTSATSAIG